MRTLILIAVFAASFGFTSIAQAHKTAVFESINIEPEKDDDAKMMCWYKSVFTGEVKGWEDKPEGWVTYPDSNNCKVFLFADDF